jgi:hypothetical protein
MAMYGYTAEIVQQGEVILNQADDLYQQQKREYGEYYEANADYTKARDEFHKSYMRDIKFARITLMDSPATLDKIEANGERYYSTSKYIEQAKTFYNSFIDDADLLAAMAPFGYTAEHFQTQLDNVNQFNVLIENIAKEQGDAQQATKTRDALMDNLLAWTSKFKRVAFLAFEDDAQYLEKLGILVRS